MAKQDSTNQPDQNAPEPNVDDLKAQRDAAQERGDQAEVARLESQISQAQAGK